LRRLYAEADFSDAFSGIDQGVLELDFGRAGMNFAHLNFEADACLCRRPLERTELA
jgi:hypothetical protein